MVLSSGEAELVALVKGACEAKGIGSVIKDMTDMDPGKIGIYTDASAAIGMVQRQGTGKVRHIEVGMLWIQQNQKEGEVEVAKVDGRHNPAYMFTKQVPAEIMWRHMMTMGYMNREGRAESAVQLVGN